jgi:hypothetical protein
MERTWSASTRASSIPAWALRHASCGNRGPGLGCGCGLGLGLGLGNLVDGTGNETGNVLSTSKTGGKRVGKGRSGLDGGKRHLPNVGTPAKTKDTSHLVERHRLLDLHYVGIHCSHVVQIGKDKGTFHVKPQRDNIFCVFPGVSEFVNLNR